MPNAKSGAGHSKLAIVGYGKMGRMIEQFAPEYGFEVAAQIDLGERPSLQGHRCATRHWPGVEPEFFGWGEYLLSNCRDCSNPDEG